MSGKALRTRSRSVLLAFGLALGGCGKSGPDAGRTAPSGSSQPLAAPLASSFLGAELRRDAKLVTEDDLRASDAGRRAAAVRTLARIQDESSFEALAKALSDEDAQVIGWAAFGIGHMCRAHEPEAVRRLVLRAATLTTQAAAPARGEALSAIALALGRCGSDDAERSLRAWLRQPTELSQAAAWGLSQLARKRKRLDDSTVAALLDAAAKQPSGAYLHPLESPASLGSAARQRLLEVAQPLLDRPGPARAFAIRALGKAGGDAAVPLRAMIEAAGSNDSERADAVRSLAALGAAGQTELASALTKLSRALIDGKGWLSSQQGVVVTLLDSLEPKSADPGVLAELSQLPLGGEPASVVRRKVMLRCRAAALLAGRASASQTLAACDPAPPGQGREGSLALLRVLGRGSLAKGRGGRFRELAASSDRVVREAALELLMAHDEVPDIAELLASALGAKEEGVRATAAKVLARYPARAQLAGKGASVAHPPADPRVVQALTAQLSGIASSNNIELSSMLLDAASAMELLGAKPALEQACASSNPTLRQHAERGLVALGETTRRCGHVVGTGDLGKYPAGDVRLELETDIGALALTLDASASPFASARVVELARSGFYDGMLIHRAVPGFVAQFGDPDGDGFGGPDLPPLRCQLGPEPFDVGSVGIALAGRDTGSSQLFVALRRAPHLDGEYTLIGHAEPLFGDGAPNKHETGFDRLAPGDRIVKVRVTER